MNEQLYYIQTNGYLGNALIWWKPDRKGYTPDIKAAGKYSEIEAKNIVKDREFERAWPVEYIDNLLKAQKLIIDAQYVNYDESKTRKHWK